MPYQKSFYSLCVQDNKIKSVLGKKKERSQSLVPRSLIVYIGNMCIVLNIYECVTQSNLYTTVALYHTAILFSILLKIIKKNL